MGGAHRRPGAEDCGPAHLGAGGCGICAPREVAPARAVATWGPELLCSGGSGGTDRLDELTELSAASSGEEEEADLPPLLAAKAPAPAAAGPRPAGRRALAEEIERVVGAAGGLFAGRGWEIAPLSGDRHRLNGRAVRLSLLPPGAPDPPFEHNVSSAGSEAARRAARIAVCDGSLRQPLLDYLLQTGLNEQYDQRGTENPMAITGAARRVELNVAPSSDRRVELHLAMLEAEARRRAQGTQNGALARAPAARGAPPPGRR